MTIPNIPDNPTVSDVCNLFLSKCSAEVCPRMRKHRAQVLRAFCAKYGTLLIKQLKHWHLKFFVEEQKTLRSWWSRRSWVAAVKSAFGWAFKMDLIDRQPFARVTMPAGQRGRPLTDAEFQAMLRHSDAPLRRFLFFLRFTGCRPGEAASARWRDIKPEQQAIVLHEHKTAKKTGKPRVIYMPPACVKFLIWLGRTFGVQRDQLIFTNGSGGPWLNSARSQQIVRIRKLCGLPADARVYGLRHKFATQAILRGLPIKTLSTLLGHTQVATTEIYTHMAGHHEHFSESVRSIFASCRGIPENQPTMVS